MIEVEGIKEVNSNLDRLKLVVLNSIESSLSDAADHLKDTSIEFLKSQAKEPEKSVQGQRITDSESWYIEPINNNKIRLHCKSEHAAIVEFGGEGTLIATHYGWLGFPVGRQQGLEPPNIKPEIKLQQGYHYLENTMNSPDVRNNMLEKIRQYLQISIEGEF